MKEVDGLNNLMKLFQPYLLQICSCAFIVTCWPNTKPPFYWFVDEIVLLNIAEWEHFHLLISICLVVLKALMLSVSFDLGCII